MTSIWTRPRISVNLQQTIGWVDLNELVRQRHRRDDRGYKRNKGFAGAIWVANGKQFAGGRVQHIDHLAHVTPVNRANNKTLELVVVELVGLLDGRKVGGVNHEQNPPHRVG